MARATNLMHQASESCKFRGHDLQAWSQHNSLWEVWTNQCSQCGMQVFINLNPMPNEIDIGGEAVALHCIEH